MALRDIAADQSGLESPIGVGKVYYVDAVNGNDSFSGSRTKPFKTLAVAYGKCVSGKNDTVAVIGSASALSLSEAFTWSKNLTHLVGLSSGPRYSSRARINQTSTATGVAALITFSGYGCFVKNIQFFQGVADATSLVAVKVTGHRNVFENCHFAGIGDATQSAAGSASLKIDAGEENLFKHCVIGLDTVTRDADATEILFDSAAARNVFEDCIISSYIGAAGFASVTVADGTGIDRINMFKDCVFFTKSTNKGVAQTSVFSIPVISQGAIVLKDSVAASDGGAVDWDSNNRGIIWNNQVAAAASAAGGILTNQ